MSQNESVPLPPPTVSMCPLKLSDRMPHFSSTASKTQATRRARGSTIWTCDSDPTAYAPRSRSQAMHTSSALCTRSVEDFGTGLSAVHVLTVASAEREANSPLTASTLMSRTLSSCPWRTWNGLPTPRFMRSTFHTMTILSLLPDTRMLWVSHEMPNTQSWWPRSSPLGRTSALERIMISSGCCPPVAMRPSEEMDMLWMPQWSTRNPSKRYEGRV
mmetsp:Transcript_51764/g.128809  ORF Transcript_51764/g.128809 Transcript_51764/m.128809 type:complete len:216 (+) Transcript_51764:442-1089(+)